MSISPGRFVCRQLPWSFRVAVLALVAWTSPASADVPPSFDCVIMPYTMVDVSTAVPGVLEAVQVDRSDLVEEGQVLAQLDAGVERAALELARERAAMETEIHLRETSLVFAERERKRLDSLHAKRAISAFDKDKAEREAALSSWKVREARDLHRLRQLELRKAEEVLSKKTVRSPIRGVVVQRLKSPGEYVEDQAIVQLAQLDPLKVEAIVPMELFGEIRVGMHGDVVPETILKTQHRATVTVVDRMGNAASGTFGVRLELPNPDHRIPAGQRCRISILPEADLPLAGTDGEQQGPLPQGHGEQSPSEQVVSVPSPGRDADAVPVAELVEALPEKISSAWLMAGRELGQETQSGSTVASRNDGSEAGFPDPSQAPSSALHASAQPLESGCLSAGPIASLTEADRLTVVLREGGVRVGSRVGDVVARDGYIVLTMDPQIQEDSMALEVYLKENGITDIQRMVRGVYAGRISLGIFKQKSGAERRRSQLAELDIETELRARGTTSSNQWWLDLMPPPHEWDEEDLRTTIDGVVPGLELKPVDCPAILTAQN